MPQCWDCGVVLDRPYAKGCEPCLVRFYHAYGARLTHLKTAYPNLTNGPTRSLAWRAARQKIHLTDVNAWVRELTDADLLTIDGVGLVALARIRAVIPSPIPRPDWTEHAEMLAGVA